MACFAEVASQFTQAGGPYFIRAGRVWPPGRNRSGLDALAGTVAAPAATANLFVIYCGEFWPHASEPLPRFLILTFLYGILTSSTIAACAPVRRSVTSSP